MNHELKSEKSVFLHAAEFTLECERAAFLDAACGDDHKLRAGVEKLLAEHEQSQPLLDACATVDASHRERPGTQIGRYKLLQEIGEGGMGVVYMAEQIRPVKRRVALKIIKPGMDSRQIIARFEAERQALAMMDHPNVARVLDAGTTENGRPFFVMELVKGTPITSYCDINQMTTRERLKLFVPVCNAVQHAHHKGIIHRDIKPSNVLVADYDDQAVPKIIDFGVAKALNQSLTDKTLFTQFGQIVGTLEYMSPEQSKFNQLDVDTRSDIYSLGVLLYELLTGTTPIERDRLRSSDLNEVLRIIGEEEPPKPSTRLVTSETLSALAAKRNTEGRALAGTVRGELDWIAMQALEKDRTDRYETASALAADIDRYLHDQPMQACPPTVMYRLRKFLHRNRTPILRMAASAAILLLTVVAGIYAWKFDAGRRAHQLASRARREQLPEIERLISQKEFVAAFMLAEQVGQVLPDDPRLAKLVEASSHAWSILTYPDGADVYWRDYESPDAEWAYAGRTPINSVTLPRATLLWKIEKEGFESVTGCRHPQDDRVSFTLDRVGTRPPGMVRVSGNAIRPNFYGLQFDDIELHDFYMDRCEVTNREFKEFVDAAGYETQAYWKPEFENGVFSWDVVRQFVDATAQPGPSTWRNGTFPEGTAEFPVQGVSWYEAVAYARFVGKQLPTAVHWLRASGATRKTHGISIAQQSNMNRPGPVAVGSFHGIGPFGTRDTAGNVKEWCRNEGDPGRRTTLGGSWNDPIYRFCGFDQFKPLDRDSTLGFRCIKLLVDQVPDSALVPISYYDSRKLLEEDPVDDETFQLFCRTAYDYQETELSPELIERFDGSEIVHEVVEINAAYGRERFAVHMFLPKSPELPYQPIVFFPGEGTFDKEQAFPNEPSRLGQWGHLRFLVKSGRAIVWPEYHGSFTRFGSYQQDREWDMHVYRDLARTVDYLQTRADMDKRRIGYLGSSLGARMGAIFLALEDQIRAAILYHGGMLDLRLPRPQVDALNFAPRVKIPTLMINGRDDTVFPVKSCQEPLFHFLGTASNEKAYLLFERGHGTPPEEWNPDALAWFDQYLGAVNDRGDYASFVCQGNFAAARGQWDEAARHYESAVDRSEDQHELDDSSAVVWLHAGVAMVMAGEDQDYRRHCQRMIERFLESKDPRVHERLLQACLLRANASDLSTLPIAELMKTAAENSADNQSSRSYLATCGLGALRRGDAERAIQWTQLALQEPLPQHDPAVALSRVITALAHIKIQDHESARNELSMATKLLNASLPKLEDGQVDSRFVMRTQNLRYEWLFAEILRREADDLLN